MTRDDFQQITTGLLDRTQVRLESVLEESGLRWPDISKVLLVGGSTKMPAVSEMLERVSGLRPSHEVHPDEAVALGAAIQAAIVARTMQARTPASPGAALTEAETGIREVNVTDVTAHSLGVVLIDGTTGERYNEIVIDRGTQLPARAEATSYTLTDNQEVWAMELTQGEDREVRYVKVIGSGDIRFDAPKPRGYPLRTSVAYDVDGLVHAYVFDGVTGAPFGELHINRESNLSSEDLAAMKRSVGGLELG
jgi:molecular chaperone DnaK